MCVPVESNREATERKSINTQGKEKLEVFLWLRLEGHRYRRRSFTENKRTERDGEQARLSRPDWTTEKKKADREGAIFFSPWIKISGNNFFTESG